MTGANIGELVNRGLQLVVCNEFDNIDTRTRLCVTDIAESEGRKKVIPRDDEQLAQWEARVGKEWIELRNHIAGSLHTKLEMITQRREEQACQASQQAQWEAWAKAQHEIECARQERERELVERQRRELWASSEDLIQRFFEIAERKVSRVDEYGDEDWDALPMEIEKCLIKIARRGGASLSEVQTAINENRLPQEYAWLRENLDREFRRYHEDLKARPVNSVNFDEMSGLQFERFAQRLYEHHGYEAQRTPVTDQGADLIAKKDGKKLSFRQSGIEVP
jgi:hypothetical protein